jgi:hypothetical protein
MIWPLKVAIATLMAVPFAFLTWAALRGFSVSAHMTKSAVHRRSPSRQRVIWSGMIRTQEAGHRALMRSVSAIAGNAEPPRS